MRKYWTPILFLLLVTRVVGQDTYSSYKKIADKVVFQNFDSSLHRSIKCDKFWVRPSKNGGISFSSYDQFKNRKGPVKEIQFEYSLYSRTIKDKFIFSISLDSNKEL